MARGLSAHLPAICALLSFSYISQTLERHSLTGRPRLSSALILIFSGALCFLASLFSKWLPGAQGRFDGQQRGGRYSALPSASGAKASPVPMPPRPRRLSLPMLVFCIIVRLETFHRVNYQQQCSVPGIESFLCVLLWAYETLSNSRRLALAVPDDFDDPWRSIFTDISEWLGEPRQTLIMSGIAVSTFSLGTYFSVGQVMKSTYFCFTSIDSGAWVVTLQVVGMFFDALIIIMFWRMLTWSRTTKLKLRALGSTLVLSSVSMALVWSGHRIFRGSRPLEVAFGSLYGFDIAIDSIIFAVLAMSSALWVCDSAIIVPSCVLTIFVGLWASVNNVSQLGNWEQLSRSRVLLPPALILAGFTWFSYVSDAKTFMFFKRIHVIFLLTVFLITVTIYSLFRHAPTFQRHPLSDLIYKAHVEEDRWLKQVKTSRDLPVAVQAYQDRHEGRKPPPYFHEWYKLAKSTVMVDEFRQIDRDLAPFHRVPAKYLRQRIRIMSDVPGIATIIIKSGEVSHKDTGDKKTDSELDELVRIISTFSKFLPNMIIPINLSSMPRVLPSWNEAQSTARVDLSTVVDFLQSRSSVEGIGADESKREGGSDQISLLSARDLQDMHLAACPPTSRSRTSPHWRISDFCFACARRHSKGPIMTKWDKSLEICHQPDIYHLHGFFMATPEATPFKELLPLFSPSKMDGFSDILFPLPSTVAHGTDSAKSFWDRKSELYWRGKVGEHTLDSQALRGSHKIRLMHLVTEPEPDEEMTMVLPLPGMVEEKNQDQNKKKGRKKAKDEFGYERVLAKDSRNISSFNLQLEQNGPCLDPVCAIAKETFSVATQSEPSEPFEHRYILLTDEENGPPQDVIGVLKSESVPFLSTTFRTWYTERLIPWLHFVPIDTRFQALHTTITYFTGTEGRPALNGRDTKLEDHLNDAKWIANQGRKWADTALGQKDLKVYMFRLLLEWGRLIDDERDKIGFWQDSDGELQSSGWTPVQQESIAS
ncbi:hypothetical protein NLU13_5452 [Sarocladium strictum]|uniref:Glycosyl transferase CAP10 domain-containing protein n=1 Tax=Sarocladium strictum TaxID=5046 RepID=A0AA39L7X3_SARSR|nr:hypothetical protein NLU13_5452 [Sarocladium strictum]